MESSTSFCFQFPFQKEKTCFGQSNSPWHFHLQLAKQAIKCTVLKFYRPWFHKELKGRLSLCSLLWKQSHCSLKHWWLQSIFNRFMTCYNAAALLLSQNGIFNYAKPFLLIKFSFWKKMVSSRSKQDLYTRDHI